MKKIKLFENISKLRTKGKFVVKNISKKRGVVETKTAFGDIKFGFAELGRDIEKAGRIGLTGDKIKSLERKKAKMKRQMGF